MFDPEDLKSFPAHPGVYLMKGKQEAVLYVGKAKNLKQRIRQYFVKGGDSRPIISHLVPKIESIETIVVTSEKEALLLENNLIKQFKPRYNALLKDDKSYIALKLTRHTYPRIDLVRYRGKPKKDGLYFGPYTNAKAARHVLDFLQKVFPLRQCSDEEFLKRQRPCILYDMKRCVAPCVKKCTDEEYQILVQKVIRFLRGQDKEVVKELTREMEKYSDAMEFEKAQDVFLRLKMIEKTIEKQHVDRPLGEDADALGLYAHGDLLVVSLLFFRGGRLTGSRHYHFKDFLEEDNELVRSFLLQKYAEEDQKLQVLLPIELTEAALLEETLPIKIHTPKQGIKRVWVEMAQMNAEATFRKEQDADELLQQTLVEMQEKFSLTRYPEKIECIDTSHMTGKEMVASLVAFLNGKKKGSLYRKYILRETKEGDDYGALLEVMQRRFKKKEDWPDLLVLDGGKGQLNVALKIFKELNIINVDLIALVKEEGLHTKGATREGVFLPGMKEPILLPANSKILFLLQSIRDEAHRFAITFHRKKRSKSLIVSELDKVEGIGPVKKKRLLKRFGSVKQVFSASSEELLSVPGITKRDVEALEGYQKEAK